MSCLTEITPQIAQKIFTLYCLLIKYIIVNLQTLFKGGMFN